MRVNGSTITVITENDSRWWREIWGATNDNGHFNNIYEHYALQTLWLFTAIRNFHYLYLTPYDIMGMFTTKIIRIYIYELWNILELVTTQAPSTKMLVKSKVI